MNAVTIGEIGEQIGTGACADVFAYGEGRVLKLFRTPEDIHQAKREYGYSCMVWEAGIPSPRPFAMEEVDGKPGIVFERVNGHMLMNDMLEDPFGVARLLAGLMHQIHILPEDRFASMGLYTAKGNLRWQITHQNYLTEEEAAALLSCVDRLPDVAGLCHGDFHPLNVFSTEGGPKIIDWMGTCLGHPAYDIMSLSVIWRHAVMPDYIETEFTRFFAQYRRQIDEVFLDECQILYHVPREELEAWYLPVAAARFTTNAVEAEKQDILRTIRQGLAGGLSS